MIHIFDLPHRVLGGMRLRFKWNTHTGEISGPDAASVIELLRVGSTPCHPYVWAYGFPPSDKTTSREVLAAVLGWEWVLSPMLLDAYPKMSEDSNDGEGFGTDDPIY